MLYRITNAIYEEDTYITDSLIDYQLKSVDKGYNAEMINTELCLNCYLSSRKANQRFNSSIYNILMSVGQIRNVAQHHVVDTEIDAERLQLLDGIEESLSDLRILIDKLLEIKN